MSWYAESYGWIKKQQLDNPHMERQELRKHCSKNYPFAERRGYAYKAFLKAMRDIFGSARKPRPSSQKDMLHSEIDMVEELKPEDLYIVTYTDSSPKVVMRITHLPTGTIVEGEGSGIHKLRKALTEEMKGILELYEPNTNHS